MDPVDCARNIAMEAALPPEARAEALARGRDLDWDGMLDRALGAAGRALAGEEAAARRG